MLIAVKETYHRRMYDTRYWVTNLRRDDARYGVNNACYGVNNARYGVNNACYGRLNQRLLPFD